MTRALEADVVVVGAGLAGLVAATRLAQIGREVVVLEARERVGGRTLNADVGGGKVVELGGQWLGPTQDRVAALADELEIGTFPTYAEGENLIAIGGRRRRYAGTVPRLGPAVLADVELTRRALDRLARKVPLEAPWDAPDAARLDSQTFAAWLARHTRTRTARHLISLAVRTVWGAEAHELSLLHVAFYVHSASGLFMLLDTEGGAQERRFEGGSQLLSTRLAERLGADRVLLGAPVRRIQRGGDGVIVHAGPGRAGTADGEAGGGPPLTVRAGRAVLAVPPHLAGRIEHDPLLPPGADQLRQRAPQGALIKVCAIYREPFWRADGLSGEALRDHGPVTVTFDNSPPDGSPGVLVGFVGGADAHGFARLSKSQRRVAALECFASLFGPDARAAEGYLEQLWTEEPWSGGGPVAMFGPGTWTSAGHALRGPFGRVHVAGAETATRWCGYLDGAVRSGERVAREIEEAAGDG